MRTAASAFDDLHVLEIDDGSLSYGGASPSRRPIKVASGPREQTMRRHGEVVMMGGQDPVGRAEAGCVAVPPVDVWTLAPAAKSETSLETTEELQQKEERASRGHCTAAVAAKIVRRRAAVGSHSPVLAGDGQRCCGGRHER